MLVPILGAHYSWKLRFQIPALEGIQRIFESLVGVSHPTLFKYLLDFRVHG